jgi:hypothetical protein
MGMFPDWGGLVHRHDKVSHDTPHPLGQVLWRACLLYSSKGSDSPTLIIFGIGQQWRLRNDGKAFRAAMEQPTSL